MIPQSDAEAWAAARIGKVTASRIADVMAKPKGGAQIAASRANYAAELIAERLTGRAHEGYSNHLMARGQEVEAAARAAYAFFKDVELIPGGFIEHPNIAWAGASPDSLVGDDGLAEFKCPITKTHIETLRGKTVPRNYLLQMQWQMACTGRQWCDFTSYDPNMPENLVMFTQRVSRDTGLIAEMEDAVRCFLDMIDTDIEELRHLQQP
jgi:putative phage-type endonuclease